MVLSDFLSFFTLILTSVVGCPLFYFLYSIIAVYLILLIIRSLLRV